MPRIVREEVKNTKTTTTTNPSSSPATSTTTTYSSSYEWAATQLGYTPRPEPERKSARRYKRKNEDGGYNSEDEYYRPRIAKLDDSSVKCVSFEELYEILHSRLGFVIEPMATDGNCLFRSVADQVYGDAEFHDVVRLLSMEYMIRERNHFSQFITEDFNTYVERKKQDGVYGNHVELQAISEIFSAPIEIYATSEEPLNIFQGSYEAGVQPLRLSYHHGCHYNSVRDPQNPRKSLKPNANINRETIKQMLINSELSWMEQLIMERAKKDSDIAGTESLILEGALKETENMELEEDLVKQLLTETEVEIANDDIFERALKDTEQEDLEQLILEHTLQETSQNHHLLGEKDMWFGGETELDQLQMILDQSILQASLTDF